MRKSWKSIGLLALSCLLLAVPVHALPDIKQGFPRLANYFLHWTISEQEAGELAKFDLVIIDAEVQERSRRELELIRKLNPEIIILAYVPAAEIRRDLTSLSQIAPLRYKLGASVSQEWYLKGAGGNRLSFWSGTWIVNVTDDAPRTVLREGLSLEPMRWNEYLPEFVSREILASGLWDGVFYDNAWDDIIHFARQVPDLDNDGLPDDPGRARVRWQEGLRAIYRRTASLAPDKFVFENDGPMYAPQVHGVLLESFPRKGWTRHREEMQQVRWQGRAPAAVILNANTRNTGARDDFRAMRFGFTTAMLHDTFYSFDFGDQDHGQTWWYDEYAAFLGTPLNPPPLQGGRAGVWRRDFEQGMVLVNPAPETRALELPIEIEKLRGTQDSAVNDGRITRQLTILGNDGLVVLRPLQIILGAPFENGVFARVFNASGEPIRAGFFAFDRKERSGVTLAIVDMDMDGKAERIRKEEPGTALAVGDLTGEGVKEIVFGSAGQVRIERQDGTLMIPPFFPFGARYKGPLSVAVGDLNKDGFSEIVVGAGPGGGPQVRIFSGQGRLLSGGFFAYDPRFRGGVRVSVGDLDGDGSAEIVVGPGAGGGPQVRIFNGKGQAQGTGFFAFDRASRAGATPIVTDVDGDGRPEILAVTKEIL